MRRGHALLVAVVLALPGSAGENGLPDYRRVKQLSGSIRFAGSAVVAVLFQDWVADFRKLYPPTDGEVRTGGSSTALAQLLSGQCDIAGMSRPLTDEEIATFKKRFGHTPTVLSVAVDSICVYVHRDNPIEGLTLAQLDAMYSVDRKRGSARIRTWSNAGLTSDWAKLPIRIYGFGPTSGAHSWIRKVVLDGGGFRASMLVEPGSGGTVNAIGAYREAIGFAARFYKTKRTRVVPIAPATGEDFVKPTRENTISGKYPLARRLYLCANRTPGKPLPPLVAEFLAYVSSDRGQRIVTKAGSFAIPAEWAHTNLRLIGRDPQAAATK